MVLAKLQEHDLFLKAKKCKFSKQKIEYLGMVLEEGQIFMDPIKLAGIQDWPIPSTVKQVQLFLGFGNFYGKFISHYSDIARPLNNLTKKTRNSNGQKNAKHHLTPSNDVSPRNLYS